MKARNLTGFTLIELMVVTVVTPTLMVAALMLATTTGRDAAAVRARENTLVELRSAFDTVRDDARASVEVSSNDGTFRFARPDGRAVVYEWTDGRLVRCGRPAAGEPARSWRLSRFVLRPDGEVVQLGVASGDLAVAGTVLTGSGR